MMSLTLTLVILIFTCSVKEFSTEKLHASIKDWDYIHQDSWRDRYPSCGGRHQSPIDIRDVCSSNSNTRFNKTLRLHLINYHNTLPRDKVFLENNGHTAELEVSGTATQANDWSPKISGTAANDEVYQFNQLHFHWDQNDTHGSEHSLQGTRQALEMHLVHWNLKYRSMKEASEKKNGLLAIAVLFELDSNDNQLINPITDELHSIIHYHSKVSLREPLTLTSILPSHFQTFYRYQGSLTTPPCSESVIWIIVAQLEKISSAQLSRFSKLYSRENGNEGNTNRDLQPLNGRVVEVSSDQHCKSQSTRHSSHYKWK